MTGRLTRRKIRQLVAEGYELGLGPVTMTEEFDPKTGALRWRVRQEVHVRPPPVRVVRILGRDDDH